MDGRDDGDRQNQDFRDLGIIRIVAILATANSILLIHESGKSS